MSYQVQVAQLPYETARQFRDSLAEELAAVAEGPFGDDVCGGAAYLARLLSDGEEASRVPVLARIRLARLRPTYSTVDD